jgi:hypothetical protein
MKEAPILFSGPMVRAVLAGAKTQTRRVVKPSSGPHTIEQVVSTPDSLVAFIRTRCPYGQPGDRLWVRETWRPLAIIEGRCAGNSCVEFPDGGQKYRDGAYYDPSNHDNFDPAARKWKPSIHMPRWASRITLEITAVRVERLQEISEADAIAEGYESDPAPNDFPLPWLWQLWESINGPGSWALNPWVWVVEFKRVQP